MLNTYYLFFLSLLLGTTANVSANTIVDPALYEMVLPFLCLLFIAVVLIETNVMRKLFKTETFGELIRINLASNSLSKLVGIPIVSFSFIILLLLAVDKFLGNLIIVLSLPFAILLFFIVYYISVRIEQWVVSKFLGKKYNHEAISQAVRSANKTSYIFAFIACVLGMFMYSAYQKSPRYKQYLHDRLMENTFDRATETQEVE